MGHVRQLRHAIRREREARGTVEVGAARVCLVELAERLGGGGPRLVLGVGVVDPTRRLAGSEADGGGSDLAAAAPVLGIGDAGMIRRELDAVAGLDRGSRHRPSLHRYDRSRQASPENRTIVADERT